MALLSGLKNRVLVRFSKHPRVRKMVADALLSDPAHLSAAAEKLTKRPELVGAFAKHESVAQHMLKDAAHLRAAAAKMSADPELVGHIVKNKTVFEAVLVRLATNPEALYQMLQTKSALAQLSAQTKFLQSLATNRQVQAAFLTAIPDPQKPVALETLLKSGADAIRELGETPEAMALALVSRSIPENAAPQVERAFTDAFITYLGDHAVRVLLAVLAQNPKATQDLLGSKRVREALFERIASDPDWLVELLTLSTSQLSAATRPSARIKVLLERFFKQPVFRTSLQKDADLRAMLLEVLDIGYETAGEDMAAALKKPAKAGGPMA